MTRDTFEDTVRMLLHDATRSEAEALSAVDVESVLGTGHRVLRRRRAAAVGATAAATLVLGVGGWAVLTQQGPDERTLPATRSATTGHAGTAVLAPFSDLTSPDGAPLDVPGPRQVAVTVDPSRTPDLVYSEVTPDGGLQLMGGSSLEGIPQLASTWGTAGADSHVLVGVLPAQAAQLQLVTPLTDEGGHASTTVTSPLPGTGRQAFAVRFAEAGDADAVRHLLWRGQDGTVHDETGAVVPSVELGDDEGTTVFVADSLDRFGSFSREGSASLMRLDGTRNSSGRPVLSSAGGSGARLAGIFVAVVPEAATPGRFTPSPSTTVTHPLAKALLPGTGKAVLWATYTAPMRASGSAYVSVTWTEDGRTVTERP
ncbi:MAG TPA: hypothetical protein VFL46_08615 [Phycicoccus sp.]|nr:hypothetical protein [Phycicoccus sp.]